jgi:hypothetical protein
VSGYVPWLLWLVVKPIGQPLHLAYSPGVCLMLLKLVARQPAGHLTTVAIQREFALKHLEHVVSRLWHIALRFAGLTFSN